MSLLQHDLAPGLRQDLRRPGRASEAKAKLMGLGTSGGAADGHDIQRMHVVRGASKRKEEGRKRETEREGRVEDSLKFGSVRV